MIRIISIGGPGCHGAGGARNHCSTSDAIGSARHAGWPEEKALEIENKRRVAKGLEPLASLDGDEDDTASEQDEEELREMRRKPPHPQSRTLTYC